MSLPTEADFMVIKAGSSADPPVFTPICGIESVTVNTVVNGSDVYRRDCAKPGKVPVRRNKITGKAQTITGSGASNVANILLFDGLLGIAKQYEVELYNYDGTDAGSLLGTFTGEYVMMSSNLSASAGGDSAGEITLNSNSTWEYDPAP